MSDTLVDISHSKGWEFFSLGGSQSTYCVRTLKGIDRTYQKTFVEAYFLVAHCKLYPMENALSAAHISMTERSPSTNHVILWPFEYLPIGPENTVKVLNTTSSSFFSP